jgi:DNA-binding response OmpR family regulator
LQNITQRNGRGLGLRLLIVDDNEEITDGITYYLSTHQTIDCEVTNDGPQGLERIRNDKFDLILLDLAMPDFSGFDIVKSLKQDGLLESKNIVIFTASTDQRLFDEMKKAGIKDIFKKPFSINDLTALIDKYRPRTK